MKSTTKAQTEVLGVVIIVILLIIGLVFMLASRRNSSVDNKHEYLDSVLSQSLLSVMLQANTECGPDLMTIIQDCYDKNEKCPGMNSCDYATEKIKEILDGTLMQWSKPYLFHVKKKQDEKIRLSSDKCSELSEKSSSGLIFIPSEKNNIAVTLDICKI